MANLTLSVDDELLKKCRLYAVQHDTSVNAMVREYLASLVVGAADAERAERQKTVDELRRLARQIEEEGLITTGWKWNRDEVYEERFARWDRK